MDADRLIDALGYSESANFLTLAGDNPFHLAADFGHIFHRAQKPCNLHGVYTLRHPEETGRDTVVPVVYVCEASDEREARRIHRIVWNQNAVPFLLVAAPDTIRLYSGFRYDRPQAGVDADATGLLKTVGDMKSALKAFGAFRAERIDDGTLWEEWGSRVTPRTKVDWRLLASLDELDRWLQANGLDDPEVSHALIGKYVYLNYLHEREILSDLWFEEWGLEEGHIFGRGVQASAFWRVVERLDERLNGSVFPLPTSGARRPKKEHIRKVAATFAGDDPASGQMALDFGLYDFSFIPIETLSVIYEQFLHSAHSEGGGSAGKEKGAYYTPVPLVNFMLEELDSIRPFRHGMRVLDPACGSGAFLVQCYRRIIERDVEFSRGKPMRPARLRELLQRHIFGIDRDEDACRVAELSLTLTLLDYVDPPDLRRTPQFRLPKLHGTNIHQGDFFDPAASWRESKEGRSFDWIVGNPPWIELKKGKVSKADQQVWEWIQNKDSKKRYPVGGNQVAEAFAWKVMEHLTEEGQVALLLPAMTLFKDESTGFRKRFFTAAHVHSVANFANLAYVLFPGHSSLARAKHGRQSPGRPAAALFYAASIPEGDSIRVFSPLVVEQTANRPPEAGKQQDVWNIVVHSSRIQTLDLRNVVDGAGLPWKAAMWGSEHDVRLLGSVRRRYESFEEFCDSVGLAHAQGFELRAAEASESVDPIPELAGKPLLKMDRMRDCGAIFEFPHDALVPIETDLANLRVRGGRSGLDVSLPPHIIVDATRRFAVYSDEFIAVPPRQIGISGAKSQASLLKAMALYLVSDFAKYHQFLLSPEWGVSTSRATLKSLRQLPVPFAQVDDSEIADWAKLHDRIVQAARAEEDAGSLFAQDASESQMLASLLAELNDRVFRALRLGDFERALVHDLVHVRMRLIKGKVDRMATDPPDLSEMERYGNILAEELDAFVDDQPTLKHSVLIGYEARGAILRVQLRKGKLPAKRVQVKELDARAAADLAEVRRQVRRKHSQWLYFERELRLFDTAGNTCIVKPLERLHWTESQAYLDAGTVIAETLS